MLELAGGVRARAGVPSGASTGSREAVELRDGDPARYSGLGVRNAAANVNSEIHERLAGISFADLAEIDAALIELDGTPTKSRLGANAVVNIRYSTSSVAQGAAELYAYGTAVKIA